MLLRMSSSSNEFYIFNMCPPLPRGGSGCGPSRLGWGGVGGGASIAFIAVIAIVSAIAIIATIATILSCLVEGFLQSSTHLVAHQPAKIWGLSRSADA